jgi:glucosylceramidase
MNKKRVITLSIVSTLIATSAAAIGLYYGLSAPRFLLSEHVQVYETTGTKSKLLARQNDIKWNDYSFSGNNEISIDTSVSYNQLHGLGTAITHSTAYILQTSDQQTKEEALATLFSEDGARLNVVRIPIGTSDYTYTDHFYTLNDVSQGNKDYELQYFSTVKDEQYLIPTLQEIVDINSDIKFVGSPWSAPAWMKTNQSLIGGSIIGHGGNITTAEEEAYATYLVKFVEVYASFGIDIAYLSLLNEPNIANVSYPSMQMGINQYIRIAMMVGQQLTQKGLTTKIMAYDHNVGSASDITLFNLFADEISNNNQLKSYISGFAFHAYGDEWSNLYPSVLTDNINNFPNFDNYLTEITESAHSIDFASNLSWSTGNVTVGPFSYGTSMSIYWNGALDEIGQPVLGNNAICYGMLTISGQSIFKNAAYYSFAHLSKFAYSINGNNPVRIDSYSDNPTKIKTVTYRRDDGAYIIVVANNDSTTYEDVDIVLENKIATYRIQPESLVTFVASTKDEHIFKQDAINFDQVNIIQKTISQFDMSIKLDEEYFNVSYYLTLNDKFDSSTIVESDIDENGWHHLSVSLVSGDSYLWVKSLNKIGMLPITIPKMNPGVILNGTIATISFNLDIMTSWSSFCDPYGKAIYRSSKSYYDEDAEKVNVTSSGINDPIYILTESYADPNYDNNKPYYFLIMDGKNGLTRFVSYPISIDSTLFVNPELTLKLISGVPMMNVTATISGNIDAEYFKLVVKEINGEQHEVDNQSDSSLSFSFDCRLINLSGVWYDIVIVNSLTGIMYEIASHNADFNNITYGDKRFNFQDWQGMIKLNMDILNYSLVSVDLLVDSGVPYMVINGYIDLDSQAAILIKYWDGSSIVTLLSSDNLATEAGTFNFMIDLSALIEAGTYYDIVLVVDEVSSELTSDMAVNINKSITVNNRLYFFRNWQGLLKIVFSQ